MDAKTAFRGVVRIALAGAVASTAPAFASETLSTPGRLPPDLRVARLPGDRIELSWQPSCSPAAVDYGIYEGHVGQPGSHTALDCDDDGLDHEEVVLTGSGNRYYLVVPLGGDGTAVDREGSYGRDSADNERPPGLSVCVEPQVIGPCPTPTTCEIADGSTDAFVECLAPLDSGHATILDSETADWCIGAFSNSAPGGGRVEDSATVLACGHCSMRTDLGCVVDSDCAIEHGGEGGTCVDSGSRSECVWWDDRADAAVNDVATVALTHDDDNLYVAVEVWNDPDPVLLPFWEIAIDYAPGGLDEWHDPNAAMTASGYCSTSTDRGCTSDADCHFCQLSTEPPPSTRVRPCGSGCDPDIGDVCDTSQLCVDLGAGGPTPNLGLFSSPPTGAEHLLVFDLSRWLMGAVDAVLLMEPGSVVDPSSPWDPVLGCAPDFPGDTDECDFPLIVAPGTSGPGGIPKAVELALTWSALGCTGCPAACSCPGFGPGQDFRFALTVVRGTITLDFTPDGAVEDVMSEAVAGTTTRTTNSCP